MSAIDTFIVTTEVDCGPAFVEPIFQRRYRASAPDSGHHVVGFHRRADGAFTPAAYVHFTDCGDLLLGGGACVDDRVFRQMTAEQRAAVHAAGGLYHHVLAWSVRHFAPRFAAIFGYSGDALAGRVDRAVGFAPTEHEHLLVYWTREVEPSEQSRLIEKANGFAPF